MDDYQQLLLKQVQLLKDGKIDSPDKRQLCLTDLRQAIEGRLRFWSDITKPFPVVKIYMNEVCLVAVSVVYGLKRYSGTSHL